MAEGYYYGRKIFNIDEYKKHRSDAIAYKDMAVMLQFEELDKIINVSKFSKRFMSKSQSWFAQRVSGYLVNGGKARFTESDYKQIAAGFRELARQLSQYADEIDKAEM